jgi:ubiquinone/menaquinone biosynthesis C-methylase UbiE
MNADERKREERIAWARMAPGFEKHQAFFRRCTAPVTSRMIEASGIRDGSRVLDVACGEGDPTLTIAERVGPTGHVLATDLAADMLNVARRAASSAGLTNIAFREVDGEAIVVDEGAFDAVTIRFGLMFMPDAVACLRRCRAALRRSGRIAVACWTAPDRNPWWTLAGDIVRRHAGFPPIRTGEAGAFRFADPNELHATLDDAGFEEVTIDEVAVQFGPYADAHTYWQTMLDLRGAAIVLLDELPAGPRDEAVREILEAAAALEGRDGILLDGVSWVTSGTR